MSKYQYKVVGIKTSELEDKLNELGSEGWDFCHVISSNEFGANLLLKRKCE